MSQLFVLGTTILVLRQNGFYGVKAKRYSALGVAGSVLTNRPEFADVPGVERVSLDIDDEKVVIRA